MTSQPIVGLTETSPPFFLGVDLGGTNTKIGVLDSMGRTLGYQSIPTEEPSGPEQAIERMASTGFGILAGLGVDFQQIGRVGLGSPGTMCLQSGYLLDPPNLPHWHQFPIRDALSKATGKPVSFVNDANAAAYGEFWVGAGAEHQNLIMLTLGTGVGGGVIHEGRLINGVNSFGSELGHIIIDSSDDARLCVWGGGRGELEAYCSASAVAARAQQLAREKTFGPLTERLKMHGTLSAKDVYVAATSDDPLALQIIDETAKFLGVGIATAVAVIDPGLVVLGGAMSFGGSSSHVGQRFLRAVVAEFRNRAFSNVAKGTKIEFASLGGDAGYIGAAGIAKADFESRVD